MKTQTTVVATHVFGNITVSERLMHWNNTQWRYTVSGNGNSTILAILSNTTGHLLGLPLAEEFRDTYTTIALSVPPIQSFSETANGLKALLDCEGVSSCNVIGHSNGGVHLQNLINRYPNVADKIIFSHSLTSMDKDDVNTINASEVKAYKLMRGMLKVLPVSILTTALGRMVFPKFSLQSGRSDTDRLIRLCKEDMKKYSKQDFLMMASCMEDFLFNYTFTSDPYVNKPQEVLIVDSPTDKIANPMQRAQMLKLCPGAQEHHFKSGGHVTMINCQDEYFSLLNRFWR